MSTRNVKIHTSGIQGFLRAYSSILKVTLHGCSSRNALSLPPGIQVFEFQIRLSVQELEAPVVDIDAITRYAKTLQNRSHSLRDIRINLIQLSEEPIDGKMRAALDLLDSALTSPSLELTMLAFSIEDPTARKQHHVLDYDFPRVKKQYFEECNGGLWRSFPICKLNV